jgi:predicted methyltransferase
MRRISGIAFAAALAACGSNKENMKAETQVTPATGPAEKMEVKPPAVEVVKVGPKGGATPAARTAAIAPTPPPPMLAQESKPVVAVAAMPVAVSAEVQAMVSASDRTDADRALDAGRKPGETLMFFELKPGMRVAEIGAGRGYTTELIARAVGPTGTVYAQNPPAFLASFLKTAVPERMARPINAKVIAAARDFAAPLPDDAKNLDEVVSVAIYHDIVGMDVDRHAMNQAIFKALKPGGVYVVIDSSARAGAGISEVKTLHRIDEAFVRSELEAAGFKVESAGAFLRNPLDARDWDSSPAAAGVKRGTSDRFALRFIK